MNTLLIGPRGCGKTSVGRLVAEARGDAFADTDALVLARFPETSVAAVWACHGEGVWREAEAAVLESALAGDGHVIALGGGMPLIPRARAAIEEARRAGRARVVYLRCPVGELARRLGADAGDRPSLTGRGTVEEIAEVLARRGPVYEDLADVIHDWKGEEPAATAAGVLAALEP